MTIDRPQTTDNKPLEFVTLGGSDMYYPRATKRCRICRHWYAPIFELWSRQPDVCAICDWEPNEKKGKR